MNNNSRTETKDINATELQAIKAYCQQQNLKTLSLNDLQNSQEGNNKQPINYIPWLIGIGAITIIGIVGYFWIKKNKK